MNLFQQGDFTLASGQTAEWKIECDALTDADWQTLAWLIASRYGFSEVTGVPRGGLKLASLLKPHCRYSAKSLIVDDVYTTGTSIRSTRNELMLRPGGATKRYIGVVVFARGRILHTDRWVKPMFQMWKQ